MRLIALNIVTFKTNSTMPDTFRPHQSDSKVLLCMMNSPEEVWIARRDNKQHNKIIGHSPTIEIER